MVGRLQRAADLAQGQMDQPLHEHHQGTGHKEGVKNMIDSPISGVTNVIERVLPELVLQCTCFGIKLNEGRKGNLAA